MSASSAQRAPRPHHPRSSRPVLVGVLGCLVVSLALASCTPSRPAARPTPTPTTTATAQLSPAWTAVLNQIGPNGEVSLATALQAYTLVFGPLPGGPPATTASGFIPSGTLAVRMIMRHYADLTTAQQQAVLQRLGYTAPPSAEAASPVAPLADQTQSRPLAPRAAPAAPTPVPTDAPGTADYRAMLNEFIPKINGFLAFTYTVPIVLSFDPSYAGAYADPKDAKGGITGPPALCPISLNPKINSYAIDNQRAFLAHELMHCYQAAIMGQLAAFYAAPAWLIEGSAEWAGELVSGATADTSTDWDFWIGWLCCSGNPLFSRAYSAIGFYALLDQAGISPWSVLPAMYTSQTNGPNNLAAYQAGTKAAPQEVLDEWASSYERDPALGSDWDLIGPGIVPASAYGGPKIHDITVGSGQPASASTPAYTAIDYGLTSQADVLQVDITGTSRLSDGHVERVTSATGNYCTMQGGCTCPEGSVYQGPAPIPLEGLIHLDLTGGPQGAKGSVSGMTLQQFCNHKKKAPTTPPVLTEQYCESIMTVAQANQIMNPPTPATTLQVQSSAELGVCRYIYAPVTSAPPVVSILMKEQPYSGPNPVPASTIAGFIAQAAGQPGVSVIAVAPVSGVGDQAEFLAATYSQGNVTLHADAFYVLFGNVAFMCDDFHQGGAVPPAAAQKSALQQCAERVVNRLDP